MENQGNTQLLTAKQAADLLHLKASTLAVWRCNGRYPDLAYVRLGRAIRYRMEDVEDWILRHRMGDPTGGDR